MQERILRCKKCGNVVALLKDSGAPISCCGQEMTELKAGETDGAVEKHKPVFEIIGNIVKVTVGSVNHPMLENHFIEWISLRTKQGIARHDLKPGDAPATTFALAEGDEVVDVFAYCNLHGLWKA